eukprot:jgi/Tetstr1/448588/TSEL_035837.t1
MRQIVEKKMLEARVVAPTHNISHKLADVHDFPAVKAFLENVDKEISDRNKHWVPETEAWLGRQFKTDSIAAHTHQLVLNSHELQIRGENELWLAACLTHPAVQDLPPAPLAGLVAGLVAAESMRSRANIYVGYMPSQAVLHTAAELEELQDTLTALQMRTSLVSCSPQPESSVRWRPDGLPDGLGVGAVF